MSKYARTYHLPWSLGATSDDKISDSVESLIGIDIVITEKLDGSNTGITNRGVYGRSHADFSSNPWDKEAWNLFYRIRNDISDGVFLFGEGMYGIHSIEYTNLDSYFYLFGVRDNNVWIPWEGVEEYSLLDIPTVPVLFKGSVKSVRELQKLTEKLTSEPSALGGQREGIVVRNTDMFHNEDFAQNVIKWVRKDHVQTSNIHWTRNWKIARLKK